MDLCCWQHRLWSPLSTEVTRSSVRGYVCLWLYAIQFLLSNVFRWRWYCAGETALRLGIDCSVTEDQLQKREICWQQSDTVGGRRALDRYRVSKQYAANTLCTREEHRCSLTGTNHRDCGWENIVINLFFRCWITFVPQGAHLNHFKNTD